MPLGFNAYVPPVNTDEEVNKTITDHNQVKNTAEVYQLTAKDVEKNLVSLEKKKKETLDGPNHVEISGQDTLEVNQVGVYYAAHVGDYVNPSNGNVWMSKDGVHWS